MESLLRGNNSHARRPSRMASSLRPRPASIRPSRHQGGILTLTIEQAGDEILLRVGDTGIGLPPDVLVKIFEPFVTHGKSHGTGLGMAIAKSTVEAHGEKYLSAVWKVGAQWSTSAYRRSQITARGEESQRPEVGRGESVLRRIGGWRSDGFAGVTVGATKRSGTSSVPFAVTMRSVPPTRSILGAVTLAPTCLS